ncbi:RDD family protein (plasmid) [Ensifer sp. D2-11]
MFLYVVALESLRGATFGKWLMHIRTVLKKTPEQIGMPFGLALGQEIANQAGALPALSVLFMLLVGYGPDNPHATRIFYPLCALAIAFACGRIPTALACKRDPINDGLRAQPSLFSRDLSF